MATYAELAVIASDASFGAFQSKVRVACAVKAQALLTAATPTPAGIAWALTTLRSPATAAEPVLWYVIAANSGATIAQILGATDAAVQANVNTAVDAIVST